MFNDIMKRIAKNTSILLFQQVITWASTFLLMLFLPRYLGPVEFGRLYLAQSVRDIFLIFVTFGGNYLVAKAVSREKERTGQILTDIVAMRFTFAVISLAAMMAFASYVGYPEEVRVMVLVFGVGMLWQGALTTLFGCFMGHELIKYTSVGSITERVFVSIVAVAAILYGAGATTVSIIIVVGTLINFIILVRYSKIIIPSLPLPRWSGVKQQAKSGIPYFMFTVFSTIYYRIDTLMLSKLAPEAVVGWYGGAYRLFDVWNFFPAILTTTVYPVLSRLWSEGEAQHKRTMHKSLEIMLIVGVPLSFGAIYFAENIIGLFYGLKAYGPSVPVLQILSAGLIFLYIDMSLGTTLLSSDKQKQMSLISLFAIPLNVGLNYLLIPYFQGARGNGGIGSALTTMLTEMFVMTAMLTQLPKGMLKGFRFSVPLKIVFAAGAMIGLLALGRIAGVYWLVLVVLGPAIYFPLLYVTRTFEVQEQDMIRSLFTREGLAKIARVLKPGHVK
ncbi:MAG TPA: flippase [Bacteroidota bacterium]|nr:flippase [Bacteroidota bacterium]